MSARSPNSAPSKSAFATRPWPSNRPSRSLAALAQSLSRWLLRTRPPLHTAKQAHVARYNKFQACRYGLDAMLSDPVALCQVSLRESLARLLDDISEDARELGCLHWLSPLKQMVVDNAGDAAWLRAQFAQHGNLHDVVRAASERLMRQNNDSRGVTP